MWDRRGIHMYDDGHFDDGRDAVRE